MKYSFAKGNLCETIVMTKHEAEMHPFVILKNDDIRYKGFYPWLEEKLGLTGEYSLNPSEIEVAENLYNIWFEYTNKDIGFNMAWLNYGPHVNEELPDFTIAISDKFVEY